MPEEKNGISLINQVRAWLSDLRLEANKMIDLYQGRIDELERRLTKEGIAVPIAKVEDDEVFEIETKGGPERRT